MGDTTHGNNGMVLYYDLKLSKLSFTMPKLSDINLMFDSL